MNLKFIISTLLSISLANAKLIMIIRHGEKLNDKVTNLSPQGEARAKCLINVFGNNGNYATPQKIYAQNVTEKKQSTRPRDTVIPLAQELKLEVDLNYSSGKVKKLANDILNSPEEIILVSWSNDKIPEIVEQFGISNVPDWDNDTFDEIWMISDGTPYTKQSQTMDNNNGYNYNTNNGYQDNNNGMNNQYNNNGYTDYNTNNNNGYTDYNTNNNNGYTDYNTNNNNGYTDYNGNNNGYVDYNTNGNGYNGFKKRGIFTMEVVKQDIQQCISDTLATGNNNQNSLSSDSTKLKASVIFTLFSVVMYFLVNIY